MKRLSCLLLTVLLTACSSGPVQPSYYLLRSDGEIENQEIEAYSTYALDAVTVAPYIDQQGLLIETDAGQIRPAVNHLWAEPVQEGIRIFLTSEISNRVGAIVSPSIGRNTEVLIDVRISQLHGTQEGTAKLVAYWSLERNGELLHVQQFGESLPLQADGYAELARVQKALLSKLADNIAATLPELEGQ